MIDCSRGHGSAELSWEEEERRAGMLAFLWWWHRKARVKTHLLSAAALCSFFPEVGDGSKEITPSLVRERGKQPPAQHCRCSLLHSACKKEVTKHPRDFLLLRGLVPHCQWILYNHVAFFSVCFKLKQFFEINEHNSIIFPPIIWLT